MNRSPPRIGPILEDPPTDGVSLYLGQVMHARLKPSSHRFVYRVFMILVDLDQIGRTAKPRWFSFNRFNLLSFFNSDHGSPGHGGLRGHIDRHLKNAGIEDRADRILLLCYPRVLGYVFNPISIYFCYLGNRPLALIYEVRNTFGGRHHYVQPVSPSQVSEAGIRQDCKKAMYVSPFLGPDMHYDFRIAPPGRAVHIRILERDREGPILSATFAGARAPFTSSRILSLCASIPLMTLKVIAGIHYEAVRLWLKGIPPVRRRTETASLNNPEQIERPAERT